MSYPRREFLRAGIAAAAYGAAPRAWTQPFAGDDEAIASVVKGWAQVPGILKRIVPPQFPDQDFVITDYGASDAPNADCSSAIKAAIRACHQSGGGRVVVPAGTWLSNGPIHLLSNVNLYLEEGALVTFGANPKDYLPVVLVRWQGIRCYNYSPLIYAYQQKNIAVTGAGKFSGQGGGPWYPWSHLQAPDWTLLQAQNLERVPVTKRVYGSGHHLRPGMFVPYECENVLIQGVTIEGSPFWSMQPTFCTNVTIQEVTVLPGGKNDDGCDPDSCTDVWVSGCNFTTNDDNVSIKAGLAPDSDGMPGCENIVIQDCNCLHSTWSGLTMGSNTSAVIRNVFIEDCYVTGSLNAHYIKSWSDFGGGVENVYIRNNQVGECHCLLLLAPDTYRATASFGAPNISNINFQHITCAQTVDTALVFEGDPRKPIDGVTLSNISIKKGTVSRVDKITNTVNLHATGVTVNGAPVEITG